jgi:hypothetical protein
MHAADLEQLIAAVDRLPGIVSAHNVKLVGECCICVHRLSVRVVIDSIAAVVRERFSRDDAVKRSAVLFQFARDLNALRLLVRESCAIQLCACSGKHHIPIVVTNQVTDVISVHDHGA